MIMQHCTLLIFAPARGIVFINLIGQETTAMLLTFTLIELCQHPDVQQRSD